MTTVVGQELIDGAVEVLDVFGVPVTLRVQHFDLGLNPLTGRPLGSALGVETGSQTVLASPLAPISEERAERDESLLIDDSESWIAADGLTLSLQPDDVFDNGTEYRIVKVDEFHSDERPAALRLTLRSV